MKKSILFVGMAALSLSACGDAIAEAVHTVRESSNEFENGKPIGTSPATIESFTRLAAMGPDHVIFKTGDSFTITATGNAEAIDALRYVIEDGRLAIGRKKDGWKLAKGDPATITVTAPSISALSLVGSGNITADKVNGDDVKLSLAGSGNLKVGDVSAKNLKGSIAGSGNFDIAGKATSVDYSIAGSGKLQAGKLATTDAKVSIAGSGDVDLNATGAVKASIAGSGNVNVTGGAKCSSSSAGSGKVNCT